MKTPAQQLAAIEAKTERLRALNAKKRAQLDRMKKENAGDLLDVFRDALRAESGATETPIDFRPTSRISKSMTTPNLTRIARAFGTSRQNLHAIRLRKGLTVEDLTNPDLVFQTLAEKSRSCPLRIRLADPTERQRIADTLNPTI